MPIKHNAITLMQFGQGDIHIGWKFPVPGWRHGKIYFGTGPAGDIGRESNVSTTNVPPQVVMQFTTVAELDTVLKALNSLRAMMTEEEATV